MSEILSEKMKLVALNSNRIISNNILIFHIYPLVIFIYKEKVLATIRRKIVLRN